MKLKINYLKTHHNKYFLYGIKKLKKLYNKKLKNCKVKKFMSLLIKTIHPMVKYKIFILKFI